ncbi:hypothetical protein LTR01_004421 [Friedmanniomyces endolithicus]|nr:hypothetical protein LTR01_004421 [Friedmanniomyces endolithicus]
MTAPTGDEGANADKVGTKVGTDENGIAQLPKPVITREERHDDPKPNLPEADEYDLPVRPPRRRGLSLEELENPENVKPPALVGGQANRKASIREERGDVGALKSDLVGGGHGESGNTGEGWTAEPKADGGGSPAVESGSPPSSSQIPRAQPHGAVSEWSHQQLAPHADEEEEEDEEGKWQQMPALAEHRIYDDWGKVLAKSYDEVDDGGYGYGNLGGAGKGYTRVQIDEDARSATSMDDNTAYLFKDQHARHVLDEEDEEGRDVVSQMQATKQLLTEGQKLAYVGLVRLAISSMTQDLEALEKLKGVKKTIELAAEMLKMWGQKTMVRLYSHMDISSAEQVMVEQLAEHGVLSSDLSPALRQNTRVKNPRSETETSSTTSARASLHSSQTLSRADEKRASTPPHSIPGTPHSSEAEAPPAYAEHTADDFTLKDASELDSKNIDLDIRWTVLCDLFLLLIADSTYDARSRTLLERVGEALSVEWQEICRFEKRVTDALEMQEQADKENWNEEDHMKSREKRARNKRLMVMGLCTVGGGLVIGLSAGMLAPVIGAGLAAGFTGIGVAGTGGFLGGTGAAAIIGTTGSFIGGSIGLKGAARRTGAVSTFEYRPLFNNKRVNLIVTVSGWMAGKVDDVRLPFSTVDPIMGDIYSVNWEPEMLQSTGQTIQILGTEALTQTIQQILGATFLATLMAGLSLPIVLTKLAYLIDNPWTVSLARADATGLILADSLIDRNLGVRPITLVGFSLGSRVIFSCLKELARRGAVGLVQNAYLFGSPVVVKKDDWTRARAVVAGRFVNGYATGDWILAYLFRATAGGVMRVAGLNTVDLPGVENINVTEDVPGHMAYRGMMPTLLHRVGWVVESEEFTEIEDPDPENHVVRQRELISEIEEARRELEGRPEKKGFKAFFSRRKAAQKKEWETYDERSVRVLRGEDMAESERVAAEARGGIGNVMFDVDAIRREALQLALEGGDLEEIKRDLRVREIEGTLGVLKVTTPTKTTENGVAMADTVGLPTVQAPDSNLPAAVNGLANGHSTPAQQTQDDVHDHNHDHETHDHDHDHDTPAAHASDITMSFEAPARRPSYGASSRQASYIMTGEDARPATPATTSSSMRTHHHEPPPRKPSPQVGNVVQPPSHEGSVTPTRTADAASAGFAPAPSLRYGDQMPGGERAVDPHSNPWADEEGEFGGGEKGMEMSFE